MPRRRGKKRVRPQGHPARVAALRRKRDAKARHREAGASAESESLSALATPATPPFPLGPVSGPAPLFGGDPLVGAVSARDQVNAERLPTWTAPPTDAPPVRVVDVLLVPSDDADRDELRAHPPAGNPPCPLGHSAAIQELDSSLADLVMNACGLRGHFFVTPHPRGCRYAFVQEQPLTEANEWRWDPGNVLVATMALSRLVRPNFHNGQYVARVVEHEDGARQVIPFDLGAARQAYGVGGERDWLDAMDAAELKNLLAAYFTVGEDLPARLARAMTHGEHLVQERYLEVMLARLVATLEGLVGTSSVQATKQFVKRVPALAEEVGVSGVSRTLCSKMYEARSQGLHGTAIDLITVPSSQDRTVHMVALLQAVLRAAVRRGIEDSAFRAVFAEPATVDARWPVAKG